MTSAARVPPMLENGAVMSREQFHRLYSECEGLERVELVEGVVYMPSPERVEGHAAEQSLMHFWLKSYALAHPGVQAVGGGSLLLDDNNEPVPDAMMFREGAGRLVDGFLQGAPELIVEIAASSASRDLHQKKRAYERNGVREYIVWRTLEGVVDWFQLVEGSYVTASASPDGIIESGEFPGLRLDVQAALAHDLARMVAALR